ncbi:hypothetical protein A3762_08770 [Oleiphilus sp. HI0125]|uniref:pseudouridine synthase n=2 Tax=Oleiphilus sp. HI0125 TaxID=1822266 RepID=UPI0007C298D5|nr:pseudouridine synthase [Oleiphilus sp. HI0125]KZZ58008.1 hypothetical protein A3762_08770 [Oleiphilus sp. HI0125]
MKVITESADFIALSKNANVCFHTELDDNGETQIGFVELVRSHFNNDQLYPVHRLDRVTSGLMLFAKGPQANRDISVLFQNKTIKKEYLALSPKKPKKKQGLVSGDMTKARGGGYKLLRTFENPAVTRFKAHKHHDNWLFYLWPETGKTHQLRVMCKSLGSPILGDKRYGGEDADRCYLHSRSLSFELHGVKHEIIDEPDFL